MDTATNLAPHYQGYIDERSTQHVKGWLRDLHDPVRRLDYEVVLDGKILAIGVADTPSDVLVQVGVGDGAYAFTANFAETLSLEQRERVLVRPSGADFTLELAPNLRTDPPGHGPYQGYVDECSPRHAAGWARDLGDTARRVSLDVVLPTAQGEDVLARVMASQFNDLLRQVGVGDGTYAFYVLFDRVLSEAERARVIVRVTGSTHVLEAAPEQNIRFEPIHHVAMDIVNNCNLRCPFCFYDYTNRNKTEFMSEATFRAAIRLAPYIAKGGFWFSCVHEATMHPRLMEFIEMVPRAYRHKIFFTTNLAKRMPRAHFEALAACGIGHINISVESLNPPVYEQMRKGARFPIFQENWETLLEVFNAAANPPGIRYNMMAYRGNLQEIPGLVAKLLAEKRGTQVEVRYTFDTRHVPDAFRQGEYLRTAEWAWLHAQLRMYDPAQVLLVLPPEGKGIDDAPSAPPPPPRGDVLDVECAAGQVPRPFQLRISWDGTMYVYAEQPRGPGEAHEHANYMLTNINNLRDPLAVLFSLY